MSTNEPAASRLPTSGSPPADLALDQPFDVSGLIALRSAVAAHAAALGLPAGRSGDLVLMAHELATNAVAHGGGQGRLRMWCADDHIYCRVADRGPGLPPGSRAGRERPPLGATGSRGLWLVRVLADDLDIASGPAGTAITILMKVGGGEVDR
jgi:anti-sigma regulatory factor (Ser/Thr protein kinase)